jgi:hypothetical protein
VTYAKFLANAAWAGAYVTLLASALLILLNGAPPGGSAAAALARAAASLAPVYVPATALLLSTLFVFLRFFAVRRLNARWRSFKAIVWFGAAALGGFTAVAWLNLRWIGSLLSPPAREALRTGAVMMAAAFLICCTLASIAQFRAGAAARMLRMAAAAALLAPLACLVLFALTLPAMSVVPSAREAGSVREDSPAEPEAGEGMVLIGFDAASMDQILPLAAAGELPAFERLMRRGASSRLNTLRPCSPAVAWAALLTGRPPWESGLRGVEQQRLPFGPEGLDLMPRAIGLSWLRRAGYIRSVERTRPWWGDGAVWEAARSAGLDVSVAGWEPLSVAGFDPGRVASRIERILGESAATAVPPWDPALEPLRRSVAADLAARAEAVAALEGRAPRLVAVRFPGLADVARRYLRHHAPGEFGDVAASQRHPLARVLTGYYEFLDEILAELAERAGEERFLMVVSSHGVEPLPVWERLASYTGLGAEHEDVSGSWRRGPDGVLLLAGPGVQAGSRPEEVDLLDVAPTAAYLLGLPIERAMRGSLLRRLLRPEYLEAHPVHFVPGQAAAAR